MKSFGENSTVLGIWKKLMVRVTNIWWHSINKKQFKNYPSYQWISDIISLIIHIFKKWKRNNHDLQNLFLSLALDNQHVKKEVVVFYIFLVS